MGGSDPRARQGAERRRASAEPERSRPGNPSARTFATANSSFAARRRRATSSGEKRTAGLPRTSSQIWLISNRTAVGDGVLGHLRVDLGAGAHKHDGVDPDLLAAGVAARVGLLGFGLVGVAAGHIQGVVAGDVGGGVALPLRAAVVQPDADARARPAASGQIPRPRCR
jgi:hypothetical protein